MGKVFVQELPRFIRRHVNFDECCNAAERFLNRRGVLGSFVEILGIEVAIEVL
jgi:hypothetical protein